MAKLRTSKFRHQFNISMLVLSFVLVLVTSAVSVSSTNQMSQSIDMVANTQHTLSVVSAVKGAMFESQAQSLRYQITGNPENQFGQRKALAEIYKYEAELNKLVSESSVQRSYMVEFSSLKVQYLKRSMESMALKTLSLKHGGSYSPLKRIHEGTGYKLLKKMQTVLEKMAAEEDRMMAVQVSDRDTLVKQSNATVLIANALALVSGFIGFAALRRSQQESEHMLITELRLEQARRASEEKSTFMANMSHELRTPMNAIFGFTQLLSDSSLSQVERNWVLSIKKSGQLLLALINDVLDFSKIEAGKMQLSIKPANLDQIINESVELFMPLANEKGISLTHEVDVAVNDPLLLDAPRLRQVLVNLISNAVKYTEQGDVMVRLMMTPANNNPAARDIRILIADTGVGIEPQQIERIFEPFHQAASPDGKVRQGTGLGLGISRRLLGLMNGHIRVSSQLGKGSTFEIEILNVAVADSMPVSDEQIQAKADFNLLPPMKVLVVDDVQWNVDIALGFLANSHHELHVAHNGLEAVELVKTIKPDLVMMDLRMPGMSGYEANDAIRSDPGLQAQRIAIVAVTASSLGGDEKALRESFDGYVRKPYTPIELFNALHAIFYVPDELPQSSRTPQKWDAHLRERWYVLRGESLVELRNSMRIREIGDYAQQLHKFAAETQFQLLRSHALVLQRAVQQFDIAAVKAALAELAQWPEDYPDV